MPDPLEFWLNSYSSSHIAPPKGKELASGVVPTRGPAAPRRAN